MKKKIGSWVCFLFVLIVVNNGYSQVGNKTDSLLTALKTANEDTNKVKILNGLSRIFWQTSKYNKAIKYGGDAALLSEKINFEKGEANAYTNIGIAYEYQGNFEEALKNLSVAKKISKQSGYKRGIANVYLESANIYYLNGNLPEALKNYFGALKINEELASKYGIASGYMGIGVIYMQQENYNAALENFFSALKPYQEIGDKKGIASCYGNIGLVYSNQGKYNDAINYYSEGLKISEEIGDKQSIATSYLAIGLNFAEQKNYLEAQKNVFTSLKISKEIGNSEVVASSYKNLGYYSYKLNKNSDAKKYLDDALSLSKELGLKNVIMDSYKVYSEFDSVTGNFKASLQHFKLYKIYEDSILGETNAKQINELRTKYETEKKDNEISVLTKDKEIQRLEIKKQTLLKNAFIGGLALLLLLSFFIYNTIRTRQKLKLQTLRNKIASDLHDDVGSTLSSISIFSEMAKAQSSEVSPMLEQIGESSRKMLDAMADIVWTINPENDQFEKIILRMKSFAYELLGAKKIDFEFNSDDSVSKLKLPMDVRKNLYLIFKEATNNMVKYAEANKASFAISGNKEKLTMLIRDNGKGFNVGKESQGNGLKNMKKRAMEIGANLLIESEHGTGTTIQLVLNLA